MLLFSCVEEQRSIIISVIQMKRVGSASEGNDSLIKTEEDLASRFLDLLVVVWSPLVPPYLDDFSILW